MKRIAILVAVVALIAVACGGSETTGTEAAPETEPTTGGPETTGTEAAPETEPTTTPTTSVPEAEAAGVVAAASALGELLTDADGNTLYIFLPDAQGDSTCYGDCEAKWPVFAGEGAGDGVDAALLGTSTRTDGNPQTSYNGWPLYYFAGDATPGDTNGQGVGDVWYVIAPNGELIGAP